MSDFNNFIIVAEDEIPIGQKACIDSTVWETSSDKKITSKPGHYTMVLDESTIKCKYIISSKGKCLADILFIKDQRIATQIRREFALGESETYEGNFTCSSIVVRILEEKSKVVEEFEKRSVNDVTFLINGEKCEANRQYLSCVSPVFKEMLYGKFAEAQQNEITLESIESASIFKDFLLAISPLRVQPNPTNVVSLLKLAHQYDIPSLLRDCSNHLKLCYEVPIVDRFTLSATYGLKGLQMSTANKLNECQFQEILTKHVTEVRDLGVDFFCSGMFAKKT
ncbi:BTB/POZ domain-containing protein [Ditylenchus destructor]|nr:BTB/POZ domain-containing protein [Ditylenchus destructor]